MLEKCRSAQDRWGGVSDIIDHWLGARQVLIKTFVALPDTAVEDIAEATNHFCQRLMDYLSSGHFEVYEQLLREGSEFNDGSLEEAQELFPKIQVSTDAALDFNDQYAELSRWTVREIREFSDKLSALGEQLEERFELEDTMIGVLHTSHQPDVAASV